MDAQADQAEAQQPPEPQVGWEDPKKALSTTLGNPGKFENLNKEFQAVMQVETFDGLRFDVTKMASPFYYVGHHLQMGSSAMPASYGMSANYMPNADNLIGGRIDPAGNLTARVIRQLLPGFSCKLEANIPQRPNPAQVLAEVDVAGETAQYGAKWSNEGYFVGSYVQSITPKLSAGAEAFHHERMSAIQYAARYETERWVGNGMIMPGHGMQLSYMRKASARVGLAATLHFQFPSAQNPAGDMSVEGGYSFNLRQANVKARIDSNGGMGCVVEEKVAPGFMLNLSGQMNHAKEDYKFGFGVTIG